MTDDIDKTIQTNAEGPAKASGDAGSVEQHDLVDSRAGKTVEKGSSLPAKTAAVEDSHHRATKGGRLQM